MAHIRLISRAELENKPKGKSGRRRSAARTEAIEAFKAALQGAEVGSGGDVEIGEGESKQAVRQNLKVAADELGLHLEFRPIKDQSRIHFRVISEEQHAAKPKRPGRTKKQA